MKQYLDLLQHVLDHGTVKMIGETQQVCDAYETMPMA